MTNIIATKKTPATPQQPASIDAERNPQSCLCSKPGGARSVQNKVPGCRHTKDCYDHCEVNGKLTGSVPDMVSNMFERVEKYTTHNAPTDLRAVSQLLPKEDRRRHNLRRGPIPNPARGHEILCRCRNCGEHLVQGDIRLYGKDEILQKLLNWTKPGPACVDGDGTVGCRQEFVAIPYEKTQEVEDAPETTTATAADPTPNVEDEPTTEGVVVEEAPAEAEAVAVDATTPEYGCQCEGCYYLADQWLCDEHDPACYHSHQPPPWYSAVAMGLNAFSCSADVDASRVVLEIAKAPPVNGVGCQVRRHDPYLYRLIDLDQVF